MVSARNGRTCLALALLGCGQSPAPSASAPLPRATFARFSTAPTAVETVDAWVNVADRAPVDAIDRDLQAPGMAVLTALSATEVKIAFGPDLVPTESAIINLKTGCIVATQRIERTPPGRPYDAMPDAQLLTYLGSSAFIHDEAPHFADLGRFNLHDVSARLSAIRSDGKHTLSADRRKMAMEIGNRVFYSDNGGKTFQRIGESTIVGRIDLVYFSPDARTLYIEYGPGQAPPVSQAAAIAAINRSGVLPESRLAIIDVSEAPKSLGEVTTTDYEEAYITHKDGKHLLLHPRRRCIYGINASTATMDKVMCLNGPPLPANFVFGPQLSPSGTYGVYIEPMQGTGVLFEVGPNARVRPIPSKYDKRAYLSDLQSWINLGPDDAGRFAWSPLRDIVRVATPMGVYDNEFRGGTINRLLGFDLQGNILEFVQPALVGPHLEGEYMPPAKDKLGEVLCSLISRTDPTRGKKVLPAVLPSAD
jgi:hypothetical protein